MDDEFFTSRRGRLLALIGGVVAVVVVAGILLLRGGDDEQPDKDAKASAPISERRGESSRQPKAKTEKRPASESAPRFISATIISKPTGAAVFEGSFDPNRDKNESPIGVSGGPALKFRHTEGKTQIVTLYMPGYVPKQAEIALDRDGSYDIRLDRVVKVRRVRAARRPTRPRRASPISPPNSRSISAPKADSETTKPRKIDDLIDPF